MKTTLNQEKSTVDDWEAICERCGRCCYEKIEYRNRVFYTNTPCAYLDLETRLCRIYQQRDKLHVDCVRLTPELVAAGILPDDCPYVRGSAPRPGKALDFA